MNRAALYGCTLQVLLLVVLVFTGCKKDDKDCPTNSIPSDGRDQFVGRYKVYDTSGVYLYPMEILRSNISDSLWVVNWGGEFDVYVAHDNLDPSAFFNFTVYNPAYDREGNRWSVSGEFDEAFESNHLVNDTLRMCYSLNNIAYYAEDGVPFFTWSYREYGVKQ